MAKLDREMIAMYEQQAARELFKSLPRPAPDSYGTEFTCGVISALLRFAAALFVPHNLERDAADQMIDEVYLAARKAMGRVAQRHRRR